MAASSHADADAFVAEVIKDKLTGMLDGIVRNGSASFAVPCGLVFYLHVSEETRVDGRALWPRLFVDTDVDAERAGPFGSDGEVNEVVKANRTRHIAHKHGWLTHEDGCSSSAAATRAGGDEKIVSVDTHERCRHTP